MTASLQIAFVSDVVCPWCVIGLRSLERALERVGGLVEASITFHPFELNPDMPAEGQGIAEHVREKYGSTPEQSAAARQGIQTRAAEVGFSINTNPESRIYNTFDAHRLLYWAGLEGRQRELKHALFAAYFSKGLNPSDPDVLVSTADSVGLDPSAARQILTTDAYAREVRAEEAFWRREGITAVPAVIVDSRYMILGGQPPEAFERALRSIAAEVQAEPA
jgi:predicted DsbA family dithiol-disulfide isomerase